MPLYCAVAAPAFVAVTYVYFGWTRATRWLATFAAALVTVAGLWSVWRPGDDLAFNGLLRADALSAYLIVVIGAGASLALAGFPAQLVNELTDSIIGPVTARGYGVLSMVALLFAVPAVSGSSGVTRLIAVECVVVAITGLVAARGKPRQITAALAYGVSCTTGVVIAAVAEFVPVGSLATWLVVLGWAIVAGVAPVGWWLPATVTVASPPVSALIATVPGVVAWGALARVEPVLPLLPAAALIGIAVAVVAVARQPDMRRLVAFVTIGLSGLLLLGLAAGETTLVLHLLLGISLTAALGYLTIGHVVSLTGSGRIATIRGLLSRNPLLGVVWGTNLFTATVLLAAVFGWRIATAASTPPTVTVLVMAGLALLIVAVARHAWSMLWGDPADRRDLTTGPARSLGSAAVVLTLGTVAAIAVGLMPAGIYG